MKAVWACTILLVALLLGIWGNARYIHQSAEWLTNISAELTKIEKRDTLLKELETFWEEKRPWFSLSVSFRELDHFGEVLSQLHWAHEQKNEEEFERYRRLLTDAIDEITRTEQWSIENIF